MIECIEKMAVAWFVKFLIEVGVLLLLIILIVLAIMVRCIGDDVEERSKKK